MLSDPAVSCVCQERLLDFTMNWQRCRECVWACDSSDVHGPGRQPGSVLIASLPAPWLDSFPSRLIFQLSIDAAHSASSRPAPPRPLSIHTLAMRYFSTVPQALCPGYSLSCYRRPSRFSPQPSFSSPPSPPSFRRQSILSYRYLCIHLSQSVWLCYRSVKIRFIIRHESMCLLTVYCGGRLARDVTQAGCWLAVMNQALLSRLLSFSWHGAYLRSTFPFKSKLSNLPPQSCMSCLFHSEVSQIINKM